MGEEIKLQKVTDLGIFGYGNLLTIRRDSKIAVSAKFKDDGRIEDSGKFGGV
jgi:hypothetical protein